MVVASWFRVNELGDYAFYTPWSPPGGDSCEALFVSEYGAGLAGMTGASPCVRCAPRPCRRSSWASRRGRDVPLDSRLRGNDKGCRGSDGDAGRQGRIHAMSLRVFALVALVLFCAFAVVGCGVRDEGGAVGENVLTAELVVPPDSQVTVEAPTATVVPTATTEVVEVVAGESGGKDRPARVNVPNRGYNSYGDPDAPITMFDFSDFL